MCPRGRPQGQGRPRGLNLCPKQTCINKKANKNDQSSKNLSKVTRLGRKHLELKRLNLRQK